MDSPDAAAGAASATSSPVQPEPAAPASTEPSRVTNPQTEDGDRVEGGHQSEHHESEDGSEEDDEGEEEEEEEDDEDEEEEPRLKYASLTRHLPSLYRNGDATSAFVVGGDKMIVGTHNGNIHVLSLPLLRVLRVYSAHSASVTAISISPFPPPMPTLRSGSSPKVAEDDESIASSSTGSVRGKGKQKTRSQPPLPATPSNSIHIATSSIDGNVCIYSLVDPKDVMLRNFGRPVQAVALSPDFKNDKTYLSGGRAGQLILTVGGRPGTTTNATTLGSVPSATGWLGSLGFGGGGSGKDTVLHSGEGAINTIKWSLSGKYVVWVNEEGIKIMRSHLHLDSADAENAWTRIGHADRPNRPGWEEMASVWKAHVEWVDETVLEDGNGSQSEADSRKQPSTQIEKLVVGWGDTIWVIHVFPDRITPAASRTEEKRLGAAEVVSILRTDCIISGIAMYTRNQLLVLAWLEAEAEESEDQSHSSRRKKAAEPELRLIDIETEEEVSADTLSVSRFQGLSSSDYHMDILRPSKEPAAEQHRGALGSLGTGLLDATLYPARLFSSGASIRSSGSNGDKDSSRVSSTFASTPIPGGSTIPPDITTLSSAKGAKIFIHSPYDCLAAVQRDLSDHLEWLESHARYEEAWNLIDQHPEAVSSSTERVEGQHDQDTPSRSSLAEFFADETSSVTTVGRGMYSIASKEKRRIGELWIEQLVEAGEWEKAGEVCAKDVDTVTRWERWIWKFIENGKFDEITPHVPINTRPPLASAIYETLLRHYVSRDRGRFKELLDQWPLELFELSSVISAIEEQLQSGDIAEGSADWRILMEGLAKLFLADGRQRDALHCYIRLQDAEAALNLIRDYRLVDAVSDDVRGFILLRVSKEQADRAPISELEEATAEQIKILVREAYNGIITPETVISQLKTGAGRLYLYFYLRALWRGEAHPSEGDKMKTHLRPRRGRLASRDAAEKLAADEGRALIESWADTVLEIFATYDRPLLMDFLQSSTAYSFDEACRICEARRYTPELIYLLSKTGQTKRALNLILTDLNDVSQAIAFAKAQDDPDLWEDLLTYSMDKPAFIHALLTEAGTAIDPIKLVRRIPSGLEIEGLREGLTRLLRDHDIQASISQGAARVLQSEVAVGMDQLRRGQRRGIKFDICPLSTETEHGDHEDRKPHSGGEASSGSSTPTPQEKITTTTTTTAAAATARPTRPSVQPGRCGGCFKPFHENEKELLVGFACGHVFHLSHLNDDASPDAAVDHDDASDRASLTTVEDPSYSSAAARTVGPKVITARLIRDRIGQGCRICSLAKQVEQASA